MDSTHQHNTTNSFGGAASLYLYTYQSNMSQLHVHNGPHPDTTGNNLVSTVSLNSLSFSGTPLTQHADAYHADMLQLLDTANPNTGETFGEATALNLQAFHFDAPQPLLDKDNHCTGSSFGGTAVLCPHAIHLDTLHSSLNETEQVGIPEAMQLPPSTHDKLDASTLDVDFLLKMIPDLSNNLELALFDYGDNDHEEMGVYEGVQLEDEDLHDDTAATHHVPMPLDNGSRRRTENRYELSPQEKRQSRALRQKQWRQKKKERDQQLQKSIYEKEKKVKELKSEVCRLRREAQVLLKQHAVEKYFNTLPVISWSLLLKS